MKKSKKITAVILGGGMLLRLMCPWAGENSCVYTVRAEEASVLTERGTADIPEDDILPTSKEVTPSEPEKEEEPKAEKRKDSAELHKKKVGLQEPQTVTALSGEAGSREKTGAPEPLADVTPSVPDTGAKQPRILSLTGSGYSSLDKMRPAFSPNIHVYHFLDNRPYHHMDREMGAVVEPDVQVMVNGQEIPVGADGSCTLSIPYRAEDSANPVVLTNRQTGASSIYTFHTYGYGVADPMSGLSLVNAGGLDDPVNIGSFERQGSASLYYGSTNLSRVRLKWRAGVAANSEYRAELVDGQGNQVDSILAVAGEEGESQEITSKVLNLELGENTFYIKCHGKYQEWVNGKPVDRDGVHVTGVIIFRNEAVQDEDFTDTTVDDLQVYLNDVGGKKYIASFNPARRTYKLQLPYKEFNRALNKNYIYLKVDCENEKKAIHVSGSSPLAGVSPSLRLQDNGCYRLAEYSTRELYSTDSFTTYITVTAADNISQGTYMLRIIKEGQAGLYVPDIYYEKVFGIGPSRPEREVLLTLGSVYFFDELGQRTPIATAKNRGNFHIEISDTSVISYDGQSAYDFPVRLKKPGKVSVQLIYDDGKHHFEDTIYVYTYYTSGYLRTELSIARDLLEETQNSDRIYAGGAKEAFEKAIDSAQAVYDDLSDVKVNDLTEAKRNRLTGAVEALMAAEEKYKRSEIGKKITAFDPLPADIASQTVRSNATEQEVRRPDTLTATIDGKKTEIRGVTWKAKPEWERRPYEEVRYYFTAVLPSGYVAMEDVKYPQIFVLRKEERVPTIVKRTIPLPNYVLYQHLPVGSTKDQIYLPNLQMSAVEGTGIEYGLITVPVLWDDIDGFDGNTPGIYRFRSRLDPAYPDFALMPNSTRDPMQVITVIIDPPVENDPESPPGGDGPGGSSDGGDPGGDGPGGSSGEGGPGDSLGGGGSGGSPGGSPGGMPGAWNPGQGSGNGLEGGPTGGGNPGGMESAGIIASGSDKQASGADGTGGKTPRRQETAAPRATADGKAPKDDSRPAGDPENKTEAAGNPAVKKKKWKVTQILGDTPESEGGGGSLARILALTLLLYGGISEYMGRNRKKRRNQ